MQNVRNRSAMPCHPIMLVLLLMTLSLPMTARAGNYAHFVLDARSGNELAAQNADVLRHPASLTKMMTIYIVFEALRDGRLSWDQQIYVSETAASRIPTKLYAPAGSTISVREAVLGMIVVSANDAATAIAEELAGSEAAFGEMMTRRARGLGMRRTVFTNASGLPSRAQVTTAREMTILAVALMRDFPEEYALFSRTSMTFRGRTRNGHNRLMSRYGGMHGIKTGYTNWSGFNIVSAVTSENRRVIGVVLGGRSAQSRDDRMAELLDRTIPMASNAPGAAGSWAFPATGAVLVSLRPQPRPDWLGGYASRNDNHSYVIEASNRPLPRPDAMVIEYAVRVALSGDTGDGSPSGHSLDTSPLPRPRPIAVAAR